MAQNPGDSNWRTIAEQISVETDNKKLYKLIDQLFAALDEQANGRLQRQQPVLELLEHRDPSACAADFGNDGVE